ncbi:MAG: hypothetical protein Q9216_000247 [Gyalolechia sp. 2 TL-2023]
MPHESYGLPMPPKASPVSITSPDQRLYSADGQTMDRGNGTSASALASVHGSLNRRQNQDRPLNGEFFMDDLGSDTTPNKTLTPLRMPHPLSPSLSDTSEEFIVFRGRKNNPRKSLQNQWLSSCSSGQQLPADHEKLHKNDPAIARFRPTSSTESTDVIAEPLYAMVGSLGPGTQDLLGLVAYPRNHRQKQRLPERKAGLQAEEDDVLADYIAHIHSEEDYDEAFHHPGQDEALRRDVLTDLELDIQVDGNLDETATAQSSAESTFRDLKITQGASDSDLDPLTDSESDHGLNDAQAAADVQEHIDDIVNERDRLEKRRAMMTDEQIARLLAKQEELGLSSSELLLFDGNEAGDDEEVLPSGEEDNNVFSRISAATKRSRRAKPSNQYQSLGASSSAKLAADFLNQDHYREFDVMDHGRPSLRRAPKGRRGAPAFELSDTELESHLLLAWEEDRSKKNLHKKEREQLRSQGLLAKPNQVNLRAKYREGISFSEVKTELIEFMVSTRQSLALPPMANKERRIVHEMAHILRLKSKSSGAGKARFPVLFKTGRTGEFDQAAESKLESLVNSQRFFPRKDVKGAKKLTSTRPGRRDAGKTAGVSYQDGEVVGAAAPEIGVENRGRAMLEKMGWSKGTALGALNNKGMLQPVIHTVKTTKAGLG